MDKLLGAAQSFLVWIVGLTLFIALSMRVLESFAAKANRRDRR